MIERLAFGLTCQRARQLLIEWHSIDLLPGDTRLTISQIRPLSYHKAYEKALHNDSDLLTLLQTVGDKLSDMELFNRRVESDLIDYRIHFNVFYFRDACRCGLLNFNVSKMLDADLTDDEVVQEALPEPKSIYSPKTGLPKVQQLAFWPSHCHASLGPSWMSTQNASVSDARERSVQTTRACTAETYTKCRYRISSELSSPAMTIRTVTNLKRTNVNIPTLGKLIEVIRLIWGWRLAGSTGSHSTR